MRNATIRAVMLAGALVLLAACGSVTPVAYVETDEIQPGPGVFSGEDGEFTLYRR